jgi:DNA polymerase
MTIVHNTFPKVKCPPYRMAIIGEAPGMEELREDAPFVGPSGKTLNFLLRAADIDRDALFLGNVFPAKAPLNDVSGWMKDKELSEKAFKRLNADLVKFSPHVIVPMGDTALWGFTGATGIAATRGNVAKATRIMPGAKILPTFHPAFLQKVWKQYVVVVGDLQKAWRQAAYPEVKWPRRRFMVEPTFDEALAWIAHCHDADLLSVDIETGWGLITCIGLGVGPDAMCIPFVDLRNPNKSYWPDAETESKVWWALRVLLRDKSVPKLGQNYSGYDAHWLNDLGLQTYNFRHDTMLEHHALFGELEKSLAFMAARYADMPSWKSWTSHLHKTEKKDDE